MKHTILKYAALVWVATCVVSCSLLKVSVATGDPLSKEDVQARVMTRGFYYDMMGDIVRVADSIVASSPDPQSRIRAIRWKIQSTRAAVGAAMQSIPEVALADMWILCRRMDNSFASTPDSLLFGRQTPMARSVAKQLHKRAAVLARDVLSHNRFGLMERFVDDFVVKHPSDGELTPTNTTLAWLQFLKANGVEHAYASGSISEVLVDINDRLSGQTQQMASSLGWSKDIFEIQLAQDSTRSQLGRQLDSLERSFARMATVAEHVPQISDHMMATINTQVEGLIRQMDSSVASAFYQIDRQRDELQTFINKQREQVVLDASKAAERSIDQLLDGLPAVVGKVVFWLILLVVVMLGLPFAAGFWVGGLRERLRARKKSE